MAQPAAYVFITYKTSKNWRMAAKPVAQQEKRPSLGAKVCLFEHVPLRNNGHGKKNTTWVRQMTMESSLVNKFPKFFWGLFAEIFRVTSLCGKKVFFFSGSFFGHAVQQVNLSIFHQALINIVQQTRLTFDLEIETTHGHCSSLRTRSHECR